jgi:futalosine hydrolase
MSAQRILLVAATVPELQACTSHEVKQGFVRELEPGIDSLVTGVGCTATAFQLGRVLATGHYRLAINLGVAGSFDPDFPPGTVAEVVSDEFGDLGADDKGTFLSLFDLNLSDPNQFPFREGRLSPEQVQSTVAWPCVHASTVQTTHGEAEQIRRFKARSKVSFESMEGAAFFYACMLSGVPCRQFRAVSNRVTPRDREAWKIPEALEALGVFFRTHRAQIL